MKYVSIDIETLGLDPETCDVIEVAAIVDDLRIQNPLDELPKFQTYIYKPLYQGEPYALGMHSNIFKTITRSLTPSHPSEAIDERMPWQVMPDLGEFLLKNLGNGKIVVAGKNYGTFDKLFLKKLPCYDEINWDHRTVDPAMLYFDPTIDDTPPSLATCLQRAGINEEVKHTALEDALQVVKLLRHKFPPPSASQ